MRLLSRTIHKASVAILIVCFLFYGLWSYAYPVGEWGYRFTVVVDDNGQQRMGSTVVRVQVKDQSWAPIGSRAAATWSGEALSIDLEEKGALVIPPDFLSIVYKTFPWEKGSNQYKGGAHTAAGIRYYDHLEGKREIPPSELPLVLWFAKPLTNAHFFKRVDAAHLEQQLPGIHFVSASIEMMDEPPTLGKLYQQYPLLKQVNHLNLEDGSIFLTRDGLRFSLLTNIPSTLYKRSLTS